MKEVKENPTAKIAIKKNVVKTYEVDGEKAVFLKDGTEFELELFNPTTSTVLAKISLNGKFINGNGLVLRPGERVFLERYLDEDRKFKFSTYLVDNTEQVNNAIVNNGLVEVLFFNEVSHINSYYYYGNTGKVTWTTYSSSGTYTGTFNPTITTSPLQNITITSNEPITNSVSCNAELPKKETGLVEKGNKSKQEFYTSTREFLPNSFHVEKIKILPEGEKIYTSEDFKHKKYCSNCGKKINHKDRFCSYCGNKI